MSFNLHVGKEKGKVRLKAFGRHNVINSLAAAAMAHAVGTDLTTIIKGLEGFRPGDKRLVVEDLANQVQANCDISDAISAQTFSASCKCWIILKYCTVCTVPQ